MPFREKVKRAFGRSGSSSDSLSLQKTISSRKDSNVYQPGEMMPQPKYRGAVDPKHKAKLENFSFTVTDWRRKSTNSLYSPMGSRLPSRNNSIKTPHRAMLRGSTYFGKLNEDADEPDDVTNVGGTRNHSVEYTPTQSDADTTKDTPPEHEEYANGTQNPTVEAYQPLSEAELANALEKLRTRMAANRES